MSRSEEMLGLLNTGKRIYRVDESTVTRDAFQAQQLIHKLVFGEKGLADTLGPTWDMIHDPRFEQIENVFISHRKAVFGGDATTGVNQQLADGSFNTSVDDLNQYSEILGEGRHFLTVLKSMAAYEAIRTLFPEKEFKIPTKEPFPGLFAFNQLTTEEQGEVGNLANSLTAFFPHNLHRQSDDALWNLIRQECPNYFSRAGVANKIGNDMFNMLRIDLVGLIADYAEVAKIQEWVLLDQESTLVEQKHVDAELPRVWAEVEILERALTYRASLRVTAAQIMKSTGIAGMVERFEVVLTEIEQDRLLKLIYMSNYPDEIPQLISTITSYLLSIKGTGKDREQRSTEQCAVASQSARAFVAKLKSGEVQPINRQTEETEEIEMSEEELIAEQIMLNPIKQMIFMRYSSAEYRVSQLRLKAFEIQLTLDEDEVINTLGAEWRASLTADRADLVTRAEALDKVVELLSPVFATSTYEVTEESAHDLLMKAEEFDSTVMAVVPSPEDAAAAQEEIPVSELNQGAVSLDTLAEGFATSGLNQE